MAEAGFGVADITPEIGALTSLSMHCKVTRIITPLQIKICLIRMGEQMTAIVSVDTTSLYSCTIADMRRVIAKTAGLLEEHIFINSTHTHSSPFLHRSAQDCLKPWQLQFLDDDYYEYVLQGAVEAATKAKGSMAAVQFRFSKGIVREVACNRRVTLPDGTIGVRYGRGVSAELRAYPDGLIDPEVSCTWLVGSQGDLMGCLINYACHATTYHQPTEICWDYPGYAAQTVERELGGICLFLQGCAGNISPGKYTIGEPLEDSMKLGRRVADAAIESYSSAGAVMVDGLLISCEHIETELRILRSMEDLKRALTVEIEKYFTESGDLSVGSSGTNIMSLAERIVLLGKYPGRQMLSEIAVIGLGTIVFVFLPGEMFVECALSLKAKFPMLNLMIMAYTDVSLEYVPIRAAFEEQGGYETCEEWCFSVPGNAEIMEEKAANMIPEFPKEQEERIFS
ncbi:neutral/alkaline non-lysosomal ceramidase N-terminal domain-containing protein [Paenibacillus eucommiae]|uniref:Neutral/alkaline non-lysosomal ceramidase N-terminal domain-containing protein n=1 Tax=Paenibacillus eucommiae TaxID=1355755 RepID=A0ABS4IS87_9BACL|nr:neutral/alkaline non-lysosomal ceramidase N-terminal domain-containing protein [Paenibacillus eucommiae]MBP1990410.1 hypothetical protein [Paenibacillus eucommiae]